MERTEFSEAIAKTQHPAKVTMAVVKDTAGKHNLITLEWFMRTSFHPPMFAISIDHSRYSHECLQNFRYFNLCFPSREMLPLTLLSGTKSGRDINKLETTNTPWFKGRLAQLPILKEAVANFECAIVSQVRSGDHTIFVGEVKYSWINENRELLLYKDLEEQFPNI